MLQIKNIKPLAPAAPPATSSFTQPVVRKIRLAKLTQVQHVHPRGRRRYTLAKSKVTKR